MNIYSIFFIFFIFFIPEIQASTLKEEFFSKVNFRYNLYIWSLPNIKKWRFDCKTMGDITKGGNFYRNVNDVIFNKKLSNIRFSFDPPVYTPYDISKIQKKSKDHFVLFFYGNDGFANFKFDIKFKKNGLSYWEYSNGNEDRDDYRDQSFIMISFNDKPSFKIENKCFE